jgi:hypothetical protein
MKKQVGLAILSLSVTAPWSLGLAQSPPAALTALTARVVAVGIPSVAAVSPVGAFHAGGPIRDKPAFVEPPSASSGTPPFAAELVQRRQP